MFYGPWRPRSYLAAGIGYPYYGGLAYPYWGGYGWGNPYAPYAGFGYGYRYPYYW